MVAYITSRGKSELNELVDLCKLRGRKMGGEECRGGGECSKKERPV